MSRLDLIQVRRGTTAQWAAVNPVLAAGEEGWDSEARVLKVGDGVTAWANLPLAGGDGALVPIGSVSPLQVSRVSGNRTLPVSAAWADIDDAGTAAARPTDVLLPGMAVGDGFDFRPLISLATSTGGFLGNLAIVKAGVVQRRCFDATFGYLPWSGPANGAKDVFSPCPVQRVIAGDLEAGGQLRLRMQYIQATATRVLNANASIPAFFEGRGPFV